MRPKQILVGTDGTAGSHTAVRWAALEAQRRHRCLRVVHVCDWDGRPDEYDRGAECLDASHQLADAVVARASAQARAVAPAVQLELDTLLGKPAARLLDAAHDAELVVVGSRGRGGFATLLLGSVSERVAAHAPCPVAVVRGRGNADEGPVAVGVDDSPAADTVLGTAFEAAACRATGVAVIRTYPWPPPLWTAGVPVVEFGTPKEDAAERQRVEELLAPWRHKHPEVKVDVLVSHDSPAAVLTGVSRGAQLVVVGSHGHGSVVGALLGSTGIHLLHHADCPVLIARPARP
ncbi:universal stress protein [Jidongwangia harbinensis]|uniref:universal stress protein n=1 Tax=Jidongwangia harbinensis TaxID=2878561 RepID=UPI001CD93F30|nr:universal stress protein [Jidongwangia harbinensis]MCA2219290.1 universal stress protein [Jidongwangia harbinensis]